MNMIKTGVLAALLLFLSAPIQEYAQSDHGKIPSEWQTVAEKTNYAKTSTYDETTAYCKKLAAASRGIVTYTTYGKSAEGQIGRAHV